MRGVASRSIVVADRGSTGEKKHSRTFVITYYLRCYPRSNVKEAFPVLPEVTLLYDKRMLPEFCHVKELSLGSSLWRMTRTSTHITQI